MAITQHKTIWITGASAGIGEALAYEYAKHTNYLILSARSEDKLMAVAKKCEELGSKCLILPFDLGAINSAEDLVSKAISFTGKLDIMVHIGGLSQRSLTVETEMEVCRKIMEVNFFGAVAITKALLPEFIKAGGGQFGVVSSLTGKFGYAMRSSYAASKHALHGYFDTISIENYKDNVHVTMLMPGRIKTNISLNSVVGDGNTFGQMDEGMEKGMPVEKCAKIMRKALEAKKREKLIGGKEILMMYFKKYIPALFYKIARNIDPAK